MNATKATGRCPAGVSVRFSNVRRCIRRAVAAVVRPAAAYRARARRRAAILALDDRILRDIGMARGEILRPRDD